MDPLNVLIVHKDDPQSRINLKNLNWSDLGMKPVALVTSGDLALNVIQEQRIDIMLADIGASSNGSNLIDLVATKKPNLLIIAIASPPKFDALLLAMRYENVYDYVRGELFPEELERVLRNAETYWHNWNLSLAISQLTDVHKFKISTTQKKAIDATIKKILYSTAHINVADVVLGVEQLFRKDIGPIGTSDLQFARSIAVELLAQLKYLLISTGVDYDDEFALYSFIHKIHHANDHADLEDICLHYLYRCMNSISPGSTPQQLSALVRTAIEITRQRYCDSNFSLIWLADEIGISPNYLSSIFRMETGMRFKKYLNAFRMDKAKELLMESKYKIYEVSDLVGIEDSRYFSQLFKTYTGMKPSEFRNSQHTQDEMEVFTNEQTDE